MSESDRRSKRSEDRDEALQYLVEAVADRSEVHAVALVDDEGHIVAGCGMPHDLAGLAKLAGPLARAQSSACFEDVTRGTDYFARGVPVRGKTLYLTALGSRVRRMNDAAVAIARIEGARAAS